MIVIYYYFFNIFENHLSEQVWSSGRSRQNLHQSLWQTRLALEGLFEERGLAQDQGDSD